MYVYLYDNFLKQRKYDGIVKSIETRLTDFDIAGKIIRLQNFTNAGKLVEDEIRRGAKTIVIVGNDSTFGHVLSRAANTRITFGFIPIGQHNEIAEVLGIPEGAEACDILARRRRIKLDVGWVNNRYFISKLHIFPHDIRVEYDEKFAVSSTKKKIELVVCNLQPYTWKHKSRGKEYVVHPQDGKLEAFLCPLASSGIFGDKYEEPSIFPFEEMVVTSRKPFIVEADGKQSKETKIKIRLAKGRINMIVGKERRF
jgi:diacylglycerol kinase family enzyme